MRGAEFAEMAAFVEIAKRGSFSKAALHLGVSRPTLSQNIRSLEERLGARLLNRTTRSVALTPVGERLYARLRPNLEDLESAVEEVNAFRDKPAGLLRITMVPTVANMVIAPIIAQFLAEYPAIKLELVVSHAPSEIVSERFDAGIRFGEQIDKDMVAVRISDELRQVVIASPSYLARRGRPRKPQDLLKHDCIRLRLPNGSIAGWNFTAQGKPFDMAVEGPLIVSNWEFVLRAALDGVGIGYMPPFWAASAVAEERLIPLLRGWTPQRSGFFLYYPSNRQIPAPLQALINFLRGVRSTGAIGDGMSSQSPSRFSKRGGRTAETEALSGPRTKSSSGARRDAIR